MRVLVLGAAVSGRAAAALAQRVGHEVTVYDRSPDAVAALDLDVEKASGEWDGSLIEDVDVIVTSPGIPVHAPPLVDATASGRPLVSELEFGASHLTAPYVAVTGTNGKTTVTETTAAMLTASGLRAVAAGNVGLALSDVALDDWDCVAVEASSFQLQHIATFHPRAAAILNIAPDHLDWHGSMNAYVAAKARIFENQTPDDVIAFDANDAGATRAVESARSRLVPVAGDRRPADGCGPDGDALVIEGTAYPLPDLDPVWMLDVAVAGTLATAGGAVAEGIATVLGSFAPGPHRRTEVAVIDGVTWIDDSKATNPHAAAASASGYPSVVLIAGGRNKGLDLTPLTTVPSVRHIVALGEAAPELREAAPAKVTVVADMAAAVATARRLARSGDTVLLAPGCASFDMFDSYAHRGDVFAECVEALEAVSHGS